MPQLILVLAITVVVVGIGLGFVRRGWLGITISPIVPFGVLAFGSVEDQDETDALVVMAILLPLATSIGWLIGQALVRARSNTPGGRERERVLAEEL